MSQKPTFELSVNHACHHRADHHPFQKPDTDQLFQVDSSRLVERLNCDAIQSSPSPINTASSPCFSESLMPPTPLAGPSTPKPHHHDPEIEELEYQESEGPSTICARTDIDNDESMSEDEETDDDRSTMVPDQFGNASLREPSPDGSLLFDDPSDLRELPTLSFESTQFLATSLSSLAHVIGHTLCRYRAQLNVWEESDSVSDAVVSASALVDQCLLRAVLILEPLWDQCVQPLITFEGDFQGLTQDLCSGQLEAAIEHDASKSWTRFCGIADSASRLEGSLTDLAQHLSDLYDWVDAYLTPALAELSVPESDPLNLPPRVEDQRSHQVSHLLDAHSYLCQAMDRVAMDVKTYQKTFAKLTESFEEILDMIENEHLADISKSQFVDWMAESCASLRPMLESLAVLASVASAIQADTAGTAHAIS